MYTEAKIKAKIALGHKLVQALAKPWQIMLALDKVNQPLSGTNPSSVDA